MLPRAGESFHDSPVIERVLSFHHRMCACSPRKSPWRTCTSRGRETWSSAASFSWPPPPPPARGAPPARPPGMLDNYYNQKAGLDLYVRRVFITNSFDELIPK